MENFNYEETFMGVMEGKKESYLRTFQDDYRLKRLTQMLRIKGSFKMLDIGCGGGILTESLRYYYPKVRIYGCDVSAKAINYAKKTGSGRVTYSVIERKKLPYKDNFFDVAICLDVMEHIPDIAFFLKEVKRVVKNNGKFFLLVPCEGQPLTHTWFSQKLKFGERMTFKRYGHIHPEFTHKYIQNLLKFNGFKIKKINYSEHFIYQLVSLIVYFWPREMMDFLLGKRANRYTDSGVIKSKGKRGKIDPILWLRTIWFKFISFIRFITYWELDLLKSFPLTAWKIIVLSVNSK